MEDNPWKIVPIQVVRQTAKMVVVRETWAASTWQKAGTRDRRELMDGSQFDSLEAANSAVRDRLQMTYDDTTKRQQTAVKNLRNWKDVIL
jgi:hypothetical protein